MFFNRQQGVKNTDDGQYEPYRNIFSPVRENHATHNQTQDEMQDGTVSDYQANPSVHNKEYDYPPHFIESLEQSILHAKTDKRPGALLIVSINNLAMIIGTYGHNDAERVMYHLCEAIAGKIGENSIVERINRDQIGIIIFSCDRSGMDTYATNIHNLVQDYGTMSAIGSLHVTCSIGAVGFPAGAENATEAVDKAYIALRGTYGNAYCTYDDTHDENMQFRQQMGLANYLRRAISDNRLRLAYQPVIDAKNGSVSHYEALLRVISKEGKISSAGSLIPVAERMGLIDMIDQMVFDMVVKELSMAPNVTLAFNVSNMTTNNHQWLKYASNVLHDHPDIARRIIVEITETAAQHDLRSTAYFVSSLQAQGCKVALDDFGSGYTSFRQLKALDVDMVKIDGAFVKDITESTDSRFFVKTLLDFTHAFGLISVAEYIERGDTAKMLMEMGIDYMQGYYFGKPENYRSWIKDGEYKKD